MGGEGESACEHVGALVLSGGGAPREGRVHLAREEPLYLCWRAATHIYVYMIALRAYHVLQAKEAAQPNQIEINGAENRDGSGGSSGGSGIRRNSAIASIKSKHGNGRR